MAQWCNNAAQDLVNIGSVNSSLPWKTRPLSDPLLTYCQWGPKGHSPKGNFMSHLPRANELTAGNLSHLFHQIMSRSCWQLVNTSVNTLRPRQNGRHFADDTFKPIFLNENIWISIKNSLKFVPEVPINNNPAFVHTMAWRRPGDKPLSEPMMVCLLTHICVTRPQWVNPLTPGRCGTYYLGVM